MPGEPIDADARRLNQQAREDWNRIAAWWDAQVGEDANLAVRSAVERLLDVRPDERVLEIACGNGALARRLAQGGARVLACDFSAEFLRLAKRRTGAYPDLADRRGTARYTRPWRGLRCGCLCDGADGYGVNRSAHGRGRPSPQARRPFRLDGGSPVLQYSRWVQGNRAGGPGW